VKSVKKTVPVELVVMVGVASLDVLLAAVEDRLAGQQLRKNAPDGPDINSLASRILHA